MIRLMPSLVTFIFPYACESWTLNAELQRRVRAMEMRWYRKILHISYKDHVTVTKEEVRAKIQQAIGPHKDLTVVKRRKLQWYGHVFRSSGLAKNILQGTVKEEKDKADRKRGGKATSGNEQAWSSPSLTGQWKKRKMEETDCEVICGAPATPAVKGTMKVKVIMNQELRHLIS